MSLMLDYAKYLARMVHVGETRRNGEPYHNHCDRVAEAVKDKGEIIESAALMHDVLENAKSPNTIRLLLIDYFPFEVTHLVETLTQDKHTQYNKYIEVVCNNPSAFIIKIADMIDNTTDKIPEKQFNKYRDACLYMISRGKDVPKILKDRFKIEDIIYCNL